MARLGSNRDIKNKCTPHGQMLRDLRLRMDLSCREVAPAANITHGHWAQIERTGSHARVNRLFNVLLRIQSTPGEVQRLKQAHFDRESARIEARAKQGPQTELSKIVKPKPKAEGRISLADAFAEIEAVSNRLAYLESALGVSNATD